MTTTSVPRRVRAGLAYCIGCGCHDLCACHDDGSGGPCHWLAVDYEESRGVCSTCPTELPRWGNGDRALAPGARRPLVEESARIADGSELLGRCEALCKAGERVQAVKLYRTSTGSSLRAAQEALRAHAWYQ